MSKDVDVYYNEQTKTLIGTKKKNLYDMDTGEEIHVDQITKITYGTKAFWKVYLMDFLAILGIIDSKQLEIFIYILENTDQSSNLFIGTYKDIAAGANVSSATIAKIMKKLIAHGFVARKQNGVWRVNPNVLMKGNDNKRQILLNYFNEESPVPEKKGLLDTDVHVERGTSKKIKITETKDEEEAPGQLELVEED